MRNWLKLAGCKKIFPVSSITGEGIPELAAYLKDDKDELPAAENDAEKSDGAGTEKDGLLQAEKTEKKGGGRKVVRQKPPKKLIDKTESKPKQLETYLL